jgi:NitT/TauT family transport system permease protein
MQNSSALPVPTQQSLYLRNIVLILMAIGICGIAFQIGNTFRNLPADAPLLTDSTLVELGVWIADQSAEESPPANIVNFAKDFAQRNGYTELTTDITTPFIQSVVWFWCLGIVIFSGIGATILVFQWSWTRNLFTMSLVATTILLLHFPSLPDDNTIPLILLSMVLHLAVLFFYPKSMNRAVAIVMILMVFFFSWEFFKILANSVNFSIRLPQVAWQYSTYATLDEALQALDSGQIRAVIADENDLEDLMLPYPNRGASEDRTYNNLRYLDAMTRDEQTLIFPLTPELVGRLSIAVRAEDETRFKGVSQFIHEPIGAITDDFAVTNFLAVPRELVLLDLRILNDLNLPHLQSIAEALLQPARRNGEFLLVRILAEAGLFTWGEALLGFTFGSLFGFILGTLFAHIRLLERALLPYVVASQTVPILAIAPMVVLWLGASQTSVAVIAGYITFFPVTINTLRGLQSPSPMAVELMQSYAASWWSILWKLRFPSALPYIFTALKVSATASVVGAIIGELPSSMGDGLARAILDFSSDYSLTSTPKLWGAILIAALVGITFFVIVSIIEKIVLRRYVREA